MSCRSKQEQRTKKKIVARMAAARTTDDETILVYTSSDGGTPQPRRIPIYSVNENTPLFTTKTGAHITPTDLSEHFDLAAVKAFCSFVSRARRE